MLRSLRENLDGTTSASLKIASTQFPELLGMLIEQAKKLDPENSDKIVRCLLCPALEGNNELVLSEFVKLGSRNIQKLLKSSSDTTQQRVEGALEGFAEQAKSDREWATTVHEAVKGKKETSAFVKFWWGKGSEENNDEDEGSEEAQENENSL